MEAWQLGVLEQRTEKSIVPILELSLKLSTLKIHRDFNTHMYEYECAGSP